MGKYFELWKKNSEYCRFLQGSQSEKHLNQKIIGLQDSAVSFFLSSLILEKNWDFPVFLLVDNAENAFHMARDILHLTGLKEDQNVFLFPSFEVLPYEDLMKDSQIIEQRMKVLSLLIQIKKDKNPLQNQAFHKNPLIIIGQYQSIFYRLMPVQKMSRLTLKIKQQGKLVQKTFINNLIQQGYQSAHMIEQQGQFSLRGGIIDFFPYTYEYPIRIELDGEKVESIRFFDILSQRSVQKIEELTIPPQQELNHGSNEDKIEESVSFFDYLPVGTRIAIQRIEGLRESCIDFKNKSLIAYDEKKQHSLTNIIPPKNYYLDWPEIEKEFKEKFSLINFISREDKDKSSDMEKATIEYNIPSQSISNYYGQLDLFMEDLKKWQQENKYVIILTANRGRAQRFAEILEDRGINNYQITSLSDSNGSPGQICLGYGQLNRGFSISSLNLVIVTDQEVFGRERDRSYRTKKYLGKPFYRIDELKEGDYVVHVHHGIGQYAGIHPRKRDGIRKDYLLIKYAAEDELFVPVDQLNLVHKYIGAGDQTPKLYRLGGSAWKGVKRRVKASIQRIAKELFELYQQRKSVTGFPFSRDTVWQQELEIAFPYEETPDQIKALRDVKKDMESSYPMERLICGDVGYGKTEIAIRAAFKATMDNKQVAILAPTTILAQQHWENFSERMKPFPVRIEMLSRFKSKKEQKEIIDDLKKGHIDIIIGTHRLVQKDIVFRDLGLLIVDEEQRFGVLHKEMIKKMKQQVDSLTLTATPIPRTLYFSLIGVREMSLINTPPELRLPIITYLKQKSDEVIREAIRRELNRNGQVYYVHNRVQDIDVVATEIKKLVPEAKIVVAHGQMPEDQLENIMVDYFNRKYDILICTTIIEIGLDIPNVNTIIIDQAHQFGLSQLYQLRGRVGRANRRAYAYLLYPTYRALTENAMKRLEAIKEFSDLGSGYRLAMRDLEIRGTGNLLGKEQHGFVSEIGFNYYCQLLEDSINEMKEIETGVERVPENEIEVDSLIESYIPEFYIGDSEKRIGYYQKLSRVRNLDELKGIQQELEDIYGHYPEEVKNLFDLIDLKIKLYHSGAYTIKIGKDGFSLKYQKDSLFDQQWKKATESPWLNHQIKKVYRKSPQEIGVKFEIQNESLNQSNILEKTIRLIHDVLSYSPD